MTAGPSPGAALKVDGLSIDYVVVSTSLACRMVTGLPLAAREAVVSDPTFFEPGTSRRAESAPLGVGSGLQSAS